MEVALDKFTKNGKIQGLVLDLRNNPGGLLTSAVEVAERFLEPGQLVVYTEGRVRNQNMRFQANARKIYAGFPIVVLVNQGSASASEIVAGALQDWGRGIVLGTTTFGKGSVQTIIPLSDGSGLRLTTAKYFTPKGRTIHGKGVTPDIIVELPKTSATAAAAPDATKPEGKGENGKGEGGGKAEPGKSTVEGKPDDVKRDAQLQRALDLLKAMRILDKTRTPTSGPQASTR
jgi:carboxyl-terminal processing protease